MFVLCWMKPARPRPWRSTDLLNSGCVVSGSHCICSNAAIWRGQVHCEPSGRDHTLAVISRCRISITKGGSWGRFCICIRRCCSLLVTFPDEILSIVRLAGKSGRLPWVLVAIRSGTGGAWWSKHLGSVHSRVWQQGAGRGGPRWYRRGRSRFARLADRHLRTHASVTRVLPRQLSASQRRRVHAASYKHSSQYHVH